MCCNSLSSLSCEEDTTFALCDNVLKTLCLAGDVMVAVPVEILVCMCGFPVDCGAEGVVGFNGN